MSYNSKSSKINKRSMYIKKNIDNSIPKNIMTLIYKWIDCYNSSSKERLANEIESEFENRINDGSRLTGGSVSRSYIHSFTECTKYQKEIFDWMSSLSDKDISYYSEKISHHLRMDQKYIISQVNNIRIDNKKSIFNLEKKEVSKNNKDEKKEEKEEKKEDKIEFKTDKNGKVLYGDAWDLC